MKATESTSLQRNAASTPKLEGRVHAGNTTYTSDSHPNSSKPRQESNMNVNGYKNTEDTQKQKNIY